MKITKDDIKKYLPHREPFLFIDEVVSLEENNNIHAVMHVKNDSVFYSYTNICTWTLFRIVYFCLSF